MRYTVGEYADWWYLNRDELFLALSPAGALEEYEKPPDDLKSLLRLVGYDDQFPSLVKELALRRLRRIPKIESLLVQCLQDAKAEPGLRAWATYALGDLKCRGALPALKAALTDSDADVRGFSAMSLGKLDLPEAYDAVAAAAQNAKETVDIRCLAFLSLAHSTTPLSREALAAVIKRDRGDSSVRRAAILALSVQAAPEEVKLVAHAAGDSDPYVRAAAALGLGMIGKDAETLKKLLKGQGDESVRAFAALGMGLAKDPAAGPDLERTLRTDASSTVRGAAALALGRIGGPEALKALLKAWDDPQTPEPVAAYLAVSLGLSHAPESLPLLVKGLRDPDSSTTHSCAIGLALLGNAEACDAMIRALEKCPCKFTHHCLYLGLGHLRVPAAYPPLTAGLSDPEEIGREAAAIGLALYGDPKACPDLEKGDSLDAALAFDLLTQDPSKPLTVTKHLKFDKTRHAGPKELTRLLNAFLPKDFKLPVLP